MVLTSAGLVEPSVWNINQKQKTAKIVPSPSPVVIEPSQAGGLGNTRGDVVTHWKLLPEVHWNMVLPDHLQDVGYTTRDNAFDVSFIFQLEGDEVARDTDRMIYFMLSRVDYESIGNYQETVESLLPIDAELRGPRTVNDFDQPRQLYLSRTIGNAFPTLVHEGTQSDKGMIWVDYSMSGDATVELIEVALFDPML